jgi:ribulose-phosphate 3-epimerase
VTGLPHTHISASILNADFARLGSEIERAVAAGVDSIHLDVMDGHFVDNISFGPVVVEALRPHAGLPFHSHLMIRQPLRYIERFVHAGSDLIAFHVESDDEPERVIDAIRQAGRKAGIALNPETPAEAVVPYLVAVDLLLVMTVHPGFGGQAFINEVLPKLAWLRDEVDRRGIAVPIAVDGGVKLETIGAAHAAGGDLFVVGSAFYGAEGPLDQVVHALRAAAGVGAPRPVAAPGATDR